MKKIKKKKMDSGRIWKVSEKKVCLFFNKNEGKGVKKTHFNFFQIPPKGPGRETGVQKITILMVNKFLEFFFTLF